MRNLLLLLSRFGSTIIFVVLELICIFLIINYNQQQKDIFLHSTNLFSGKIYTEKKKITDFISLRKVNEDLAMEVTALKKRLLLLEGYGEQKNIDTLANLSLTPARVINQSISSFNNYITIDKGTEEGIESGMGVIGLQGVIGVVTKATPNYALVLSVLNTTSGISAKLKGKNYFGVFKWEPGTDLSNFRLESIPKHANINIGDTILTSGYSTFFPPNIYMGRVRAFNFKKGKSNYNIEVDIDINLSNLEYVYIVENEDALEIKELENSIE